MTQEPVTRSPNWLVTATSSLDDSGRVCLCGHRERDHGFDGRCRVPGCLCGRFEPLPGIGAPTTRR